MGEAPQYMTYGAQTYGNEQSYGESTQQSGYRKLQAYGAPEDSSGPAFSSGPDGTIDTRGLRINRTGTIVLWIAFAILFLLACYYLRMFHWYTPSPRETTPPISTWSTLTAKS